MVNAGGKGEATASCACPKLEDKMAEGDVNVTLVLEYAAYNGKAPHVFMVKA